MVIPFPVVHVYVAAAVLVFAVRFTVPVVQVVFGLAVAVTVGRALTVTSTIVNVDVQPVSVLVPVTL